ncbi:hypothetical protein RD792_006465 [Penstemon davidsonii]|uniref:Cytochrome P450 n=1 Tax=Penstemon davidsonii TaxID=160366 RepID=A0ABR0DDV5_9LAMI|nr:hypothetical protein RD792_006465 [Penstemon davidsonii]
MLSFQQNQIPEFLLHPFLLSVVSLFSIYILTKCIIFKPCSKIKRLPPSPPKLPILGNLHQLRPLTHRSFQSLGRKYGPVMLLHFGSKPVIIVQSAEAAMEIMKTHDIAFASRPNMNAARRLTYNGKDISMAPYGEYWRKLKSVVVIHLLSNKMVQSFNFIRQEETALLMKKIKLSCSSSNSPPVINLSEMFTSQASDVICRSAFGRKYSEGEDGEKFLMLIKELFHLIGKIGIGEFIPCLSWINSVNGFDARVDKVAKELDCFLDQVIQEHQNIINDNTVMDESRHNFMGILLKIYNDNTAGSVSIDAENIKGIILDVLIGGTDSTSATLVWAMTELLRHPIVMNKLQNEIREILMDKHEINDKDLEKMHYLKAVVKETLRYHAPTPIFNREAREDAKVMGYDVAAGTMILINAWAIGRDPTYWDEPEIFKPERFLNSSLDIMGLDFELLPFGSGRRSCPAITFAMANVEIVLASLLQNFDWELPHGIKPEDLDTLELHGTTIHKRNPLFATPTLCYF